MKKIILSLIVGVFLGAAFFLYEKFIHLRPLSLTATDNKKIAEMLNRAYADEWLAYYQYWLGALLVEGPQKDLAVKELKEHADDELRHAGMLAKRIIELGEKPILEPSEWYMETVCGYAAPYDPKSEVIVKQNLEGEICAIGVYEKILKVVKNKDKKTAVIIAEILKDEIEHKEDLEKILNRI